MVVVEDVPLSKNGGNHGWVRNTLNLTAIVRIVAGKALSINSLLQRVK